LSRQPHGNTFLLMRTLF